MKPISALLLLVTLSLVLLRLRKLRSWFLRRARMSDTQKFNEATWKPKSVDDIKRIREFAAKRSGIS